MATEQPGPSNFLGFESELLFSPTLMQKQCNVICPGELECFILEGCIGKTWHSRGGRAVFIFVMNFLWENCGIWRVLEMESIHEVENKIKVAVYLTKARQVRHLVTIFNRHWKKCERVKLSSDKCAKLFIYKEHKSGTSALRRHTYFLSSMCLFNISYCALAYLLKLFVNS